MREQQEPKQQTTEIPAIVAERRDEQRQTAAARDAYSYEDENPYICRGLD